MNRKDLKHLFNTFEKKKRIRAKINLKIKTLTDIKVQEKEAIDNLQLQIDQLIEEKRGKEKKYFACFKSPGTRPKS